MDRSFPIKQDWNFLEAGMQICFRFQQIQIQDIQKFRYGIESSGKKLVTHFFTIFPQCF